MSQTQGFYTRTRVANLIGMNDGSRKRKTPAILRDGKFDKHVGESPGRAVGVRIVGRTRALVYFIPRTGLDQILARVF